MVGKVKSWKRISPPVKRVRFSTSNSWGNMSDVFFGNRELSRMILLKEFLSQRKGRDMFSSKLVKEHPTYMKIMWISFFRFSKYHTNCILYLVLEPLQHPNLMWVSLGLCM
jgi:hypothetical protein